MHISEGVLSPPVLVAGGVLTLAGTALGLARMKPQEVPRTGVMASALFVASLIHFPVGVTSVHLLLTGLSGAILGWALFPAMLVALLLQALLFQFGGLSTLGVNTFNLAMPGVLCSFLIRNGECSRFELGVRGFAAGALPVLGSGLLLSTTLYLSGKEFLRAAQFALAAHLPVMLVEGLVTAFILSFLRTVKPSLLRK